MQTIRTIHITPPLPSRGSCVALGLFDGVHRGHRAVLDTMLSLSRERELAPVAFSFTTHHHTPAGKRAQPRLTLPETFSALLESLGVATLCCPDFDEFMDMPPDAFVRDGLARGLGAACVVCGEDFRFGKGAAGDAALLRALCEREGLEAHIVPAVELDGAPVSSTRIRRLIESGDVAGANRLLGRRFSVELPVIHGKRLGHELGWPTINQALPPGFVVPRYGVYATLTRVGGGLYGSVTNVGVKPTVGSEVVLAETHIQHYSGDLYEHTVPVEFLDFLRPERRFDSLDELRERIALDNAAAARTAAPYLPEPTR